MKSKTVITIIILISLFLINTCLTEGAVNIKIEPKILDSIRNPVSYAGKIIISYENTSVNSVQLNRLELLSSKNTIFEKELDEPPFEYNSSLYLVEKVMIEPNVIFQNEFRAGITKNLTINVYYDYLNESYISSLDFSITVLEHLPNIGQDIKSTSEMRTMILPLQSGLYYGDLHIHTGYSSWIGYDGSFWSGDDNCAKESLNWGGSTIEEIKSQASALDLDWFTITDHSYCLDSSEWENLESECETYTDSSFLCLAGEEMSVDEEVGDFETLCDNNKVETAHLGIRGLNDFISQNPSGVWCPDEPDAQEIIDQINDIEGVSIVNHPYTELEIWDFESFDADAIDKETGVEMWNGEWDNYDNKSHDKWIKLLLGDKKTFIYSGTDTHDGASDVVYNGVYLNNFDATSLLTKLREGNSFISNNGALNFGITTKSISGKLGEAILVKIGDSATFKAEYNLVNDCRLKLYEGVIGNLGETIIKDWGIVSGESSKIFTAYWNSGNSYYRLECISNDGKSRIYTNPIWVTPINCFKNSDCGTDSTNPYCSGNNACETTLTYICNNPRTEQSYCTSSSRGGCHSCPFGCNEINSECKNASSIDLTINSPNKDIFNDRRILLDLKTTEKVDEITYKDLSDSKPQERRLCSNCDTYNKEKSFNDGQHNITFRAIKNNSVADEENVSFFVDSKNPRISRTNPSRGFASGIFNVEFREDNPRELTLHYGNDLTGFKDDDVEFENGVAEDFVQTSSDGSSGGGGGGINPNPHYSVSCLPEDRAVIECEFSVNLSEFDGQDISYSFVVQDIAGSKDESKPTLIKVDTSSPILNNPYSFWTRGEGRYSNYIYFDMSITELNFDEAVLSYNYRGRTTEKRLCSRLRYGKCEYKFRTSADYSNFKLRLRDKAGNKFEKELVL